ncbi:hypothetical protein EJD97_012382 [Solanum chilense]|uniref:Pyrroline-5-carboxylate reductase n=1 Tax=Solanum chilense TaxID=4083 RepID=A0A6N2BFG1_SOLCI|nr:hypothetical protein EJD97_012382 [Solanum chilense]
MAQIEETESIISSIFFIKIMSKRRTWVFLFISVYAILLSISWNFLKSVLSWYESTISANSSISYSGWPALYASVLLGVAFGVLSMVAALSVALPATLVTWITILVLLTFAGKPRRDLVLQGKILTLDITRFVIKILIKEGNVVAALCAVLAYLFLVISSNKQPQNGLLDDH